MVKTSDPERLVPLPSMLMLLLEISLIVDPVPPKTIVYDDPAISIDCKETFKIVLELNMARPAAEMLPAEDELTTLRPILSPEFVVNVPETV